MKIIEKHRKTALIQGRTAKIVIGVMIMLMLITTVSAFNFDNVKRVKGNGRAGYPNLEIKNSFGLGKVLWSGELTKNTNRCGSNCEAQQTITLQDPGSLVEDIRFETVMGDGSRIEQPIKSYQFYIKIDSQSVEVDNYEDVCEEVYIPSNKTIVSVCNYIKVGTITKQKPIWRKYSLGEEFPAGTYEMKLVGEKKSSKTVDWIIQSQGEWLNEWALWSSDDIKDFDAYWKLNEASGNATDTTGGDYNGTNDGGVSFISGKLNNAAHFTNDLFTVGNVLDLGAVEFTIAGWLNTSTNAVYNNLLGKSDGANPNNWGVQLHNNKLAFRNDYTGSYKIEGDDTINDGAWHHFVILRNSTTNMRMYIDGVLQSNTPVETTNWTNGEDFKIGSADGYSNNFTGDLDNIIVIVGTAWTDTQVAADYNGGTGKEYGSYVTLNSPIDNFITSSSQVNFNCSATLIGSTLTNISLWHNASGVWEINQTTTVSGTSNSTVISPSFGEGNILWTCEGCDADGDCGFATENRTIEFDFSGPTISLSAPPSIIGFAKEGDTLNLNWTVTDSNLDSCWQSYNNTNTTVTCTDNTTTFNVVTSFKNSIFYANDSAGTINFETIYWDYNVFENNQTYNLTTSETKQEGFVIDIDYNSSYWDNIEASLFYNQTTYIATKTGLGDNIRFDRSIQVPSLGVQEIYNFSWNFALTNSTATYYINSSFSNQTVTPISFLQCGGTSNVTAINFTLTEEATFALLNGSLEAVINYWVSGNGSSYSTFLFKNTTDNNTNYKFCIDPGDATFYIDGVISYYKEDYDPREYIFDDYAVSNQTEEISLYLATTASTDIVTITVYDEDDVEVEDANIYVQRWDIGTNNFYTVGILQTTSGGTATINLRLNDAWYRYTVVYNGITYLITTPAKETSTTKTLRITLAETNPFTSFNDIDYTFTFNNETDTFVLSYVDSTGAVQTGCVRILELIANSTTQYDLSCVQSVSGSVSKVVDKNGTFVGQALFTLNSNYSSTEKVVDSIVVRIGLPTRFATIGSFGQVATLVLAGTAAMVGVAAGSIILGLALIVVVLIGSNLLGFITLFPAVMYSLISIIILIAFAIKRKGN